MLENCDGYICFEGFDCFSGSIGYLFEVMKGTAETELVASCYDFPHSANEI